VEEEIFGLEKRGIREGKGVAVRRMGGDVKFLVRECRSKPGNGRVCVSQPRKTQRKKR